MGIFFKCKWCASDLYSPDIKEDLTFPVEYICHVCRRKSAYTIYEIQEERYNLICTFCNGNFHVKRSLPLPVRCPHCLSHLYVGSDGSVIVTRNGQLPTTTKKGTASGALGGLALGALIGGPVGALLGALAGGVLGAAQDNREGEYL